MSDFFWTDIELVIFDADGTLRRRKDGQEKPPLADDEWELIPGIEDAIDAIRDLPLVFGIASNQQCVAREEVPEWLALDMLKKLDFNLNLHGNIHMCPHLENTCACRKPSPGMLYAIMMFWNVDPNKTVMIGDSLADKQASDRAGCHYLPVEQFIDLGKE